MQLQIRPTLVLISVVAALSVLLSPIAFTSSKQEGAAIEISEIHGVTIHRNPPQSKLDELGVSSWPTWSHGPSKFPWTFKSAETMYLLEGKVKVQVLAEDGGGEKDEEWFEIRGGDLAVFPKGMNIMWDMVESVKKHYRLDKEGGGSASAQSA